MQIPEYFDVENQIRSFRGATGRAISLNRDTGPEKKQRFMRVTVSLMLMVGIALGSIATVAASARYAAVTVDGKLEPVVEMTSTATADILKQAGVSAGTDDIVRRTDETSGNVDLTVLTAKRVTVSVDGSPRVVMMHFGDTVSAALAKAGVSLGANDLVSADNTARVTDGMGITVTRRCAVSITADGKTVNTLVEQGTVSHALSQAGITLGPNDTTNVCQTSNVADGMTIQVGRITYKDVTTTQPVAFSTVTKEDSSIDAGTKSVATQGQNGVKTIVTRQKLCNGKVVQSSVLKAEVTKQPVNEVVTVGTKSLARAYASVHPDGSIVDQNGNTVSYRKVYTGRCTAYNCGTYTATGERVHFGLVAVNPNIIPYGSRLYICSPDGGTVYGYAIASDTGGAAMSGRIVADLYYPSESQCVNFGSRTMNVYVLN